MILFDAHLLIFYLNGAICSRSMDFGGQQIGGSLPFSVYLGINQIYDPMTFSSIFLSLALFAAGDPPQFEEQTIDDQVEIGYGLAIGDVDGDGKPDILMADKKQFVWYRNGDWERFVMVDNLTEYDNVCIAARDINGDGLVEVAVGAQWNPSETADLDKSGSVHYLIRPEDPTQPWTPVELHHEPTIHRMRWVKAGDNNYQLIVLPLHGRGNQNGEGAGVKVIAYEKPEDPRQAWRHSTIDSSMHLTHNLELVPDGTGEKLLIGGKEGVKAFSFNGGKWRPAPTGAWLVDNRSFGEIRIAGAGDARFLAGIEPMHGNILSVHTFPKSNTSPERSVLTSEFNQGHALATGDLLGNGTHEIVAGWRNPDKDGKVGVKLFTASDQENPSWEAHWIDDNGMACEDLVLADLDGDGRLDIIAAGRATHNLKIYWNKNSK
jgi:hypothetical protein